MRGNVKEKEKPNLPNNRVSERLLEEEMENQGTEEEKEEDEENK